MGLYEYSGRRLGRKHESEPRREHMECNESCGRRVGLWRRGVEQPGAANEWMECVTNVVAGVSADALLFLYARGF